MLKENDRVVHFNHGPGKVYEDQDHPDEVLVWFDTEPDGWRNPLLVSYSVLKSEVNLVERAQKALHVARARGEFEDQDPSGKLSAIPTELMNDHVSEEHPLLNQRGAVTKLNSGNGGDIEMENNMHDVRMITEEEQIVANMPEFAVAFIAGHQVEVKAVPQIQLLQFFLPRTGKRSSIHYNQLGNEELLKARLVSLVINEEHVKQ